MKKFALLLVVVLAFATTMFAGVFTGGKNSATVNIREKVTVGSITLAAGEYKVTWTDAGQVTFAQGKKTVATIPGTVTAQENPGVSVLTSTEGSATVLNGLRLKTALITFGGSSKGSH